MADHVKQETRVVVERVNVRRGWLFRESEPGKVQNEDLELGSKLARKGEKVDAARWANERGRSRRKVATETQVYDTCSPSIAVDGPTLIILGGVRVERNVNM